MCLDEEDDDDDDDSKDDVDKECDCCLSCFTKCKCAQINSHRLSDYICSHRHFLSFSFLSQSLFVYVCVAKIESLRIFIFYHIDECNFCERKMVVCVLYTKVSIWPIHLKVLEIHRYSFHLLERRNAKNKNKRRNKSGCGAWERKKCHEIGFRDTLEFDWIHLQLS